MTMRPLADALERCGWSSTVIDARSSVDSPESFRASAARQIVRPGGVLVGHSGAGAFLPALAAQCGSSASVFVDAVVPPGDAAFRPSEPFVAFLDTLPIVGGMLPRWDEWWPASVMEALVADADAREALTGEFPRLRRDFYDRVIEVTPDWMSRPCAYVQLSPAYDADRDRAAALGWPVRTLDGAHLDVFTTPDVVAGALIEAVGALRL